MPQGYIDVPLTPRQRQAAPVSAPAEVSLTLRDQPSDQTAAGYEDVPIWSSRAAPTERLMQPRPEPVSHTADFLREIWAGINPVEFATSVVQMGSDIPGTLRGLGDAQGRLGVESIAAFKQGDVLTGTRKLINYLTPVVGLGMDRSAELMEEGKYGAGLGASTSIASQIVAPALMRRMVPNTPIPVAPTNPNALERAAVAFGVREGVPLDAATATGNPVVRVAQALADRTAAGSYVAGQARQAQARALGATGERLATRASAVPTTSEQAGTAVRGAVTQEAGRFHGIATAAYERLRQFEAQARQRIGQVGGVQAPAGAAQPFTAVPLAVDISSTKAAMQPIYAALKREAELVPLMGDKARALTALDRLMGAPDLAPLSVADAALGDLKGIARVDQAFQRTAGQGIAAEAVKHLDASVARTARQAGPDIFDALMEGRAATVNKYKTMEVLEGLHPSEGVKVARQLTAPKDAAIAQLRAVQQRAPQQIGAIARAYLEDLFEVAKAEGGFTRTDRLWADWQKLGPATKRLLFRDPTLVRDLDSFFLLAKRLADNPNPSGTAFTLAIGGQGALLLNAPLTGLMVQIGGAGTSALLRDPRALKLILGGLRMPKGNTAAATAAATELTRIARESGVPLVPVPAAAETVSGGPPRP